MPKRQYDDDEQVSRASSKRPKTRDSEEEESEEEIPKTQTRPKRERKDKRKGADSDEEEDQDGNEEDGEEDADDFEKVHGEKLRAVLENRRRTLGGVAEHGVIEYIEMTQFMCHKLLKFHFGPQINFIIGHNGSGKSAVLSAITVALGGKAASTGRGNGLKSFIREGQSVSEVTIHLKNQGDEAFKPKEYGKSIHITRRFTKDGSSTWKIKSQDDKVISNKKDELAAICDHMNIQVDNPMNVLTQDAARQFLSASVPQDKYKFFLRGTQLSQLSEEYELALENITQTAKLLSVKKEALPDLRARLREVTARYEEAAKAREQKKKVDDLKKELAWSHVAGKQLQLDKKMQEAAKLARRLPKIEESIQMAQADFDEATANITEFESQFTNLEGVEHLNKRKNELATEMRENKKKIVEINGELTQMNSSIKAINYRITELEKQIEDETRRMAVNTQARRDETQRRLGLAKEDVSRLENDHQNIIMERKNEGLAADNIRARGEELDQQKAALQKQIMECDNTIKSAQHQAKDALVPYGKNIKGVLEKIDAMRWAGDKPLGPLGLYVKAKDPNKWGEILRNQLGNYLIAFAVTDARDRQQLKNLLVQSGNPNTMIIVYEKDLFDYRHGEPPENLLTVLRALDISDPYVLRILINQARIESQVLAQTRREAQDILQRLRGGRAWSHDKFAVQVYPEGGVSSSPLNIRTGNGAMSLLLTGRDTASEIRHFTDQKAHLEEQWHSINRDVEVLKPQFTAHRRSVDRLSDQEKRLLSELRTAKQNVANLQAEANEELPAGLQGFEGAKQEAEEEKESIKEQFKDVMAQKVYLDEQQHGLQHQTKEVKEMLGEYEGKRNAIQVQMDAAVEQRMTAQNAKRHMEDKHAKEKKEVDVAQEAVEVLETEFENWTAKALEYCEQVPNPRKVEDIERQLESVSKALKEREKRQGASVEEMVQEVNKAKGNLEKVEKELKQMSALNKALKASLLIRLARWQEFRRHIALRCKHVFQYHLSNRGYYGKILFNHDKGNLDIRVQTDDQAQTQGNSREKDPRSLSGGEKSFSTICLLLSLWECIGCPLRCLDEFDVFMDAINRRISMKMMIDTANTSDRKQYILITPQDMTNVQLGPTVRVLRMPDPERDVDAGANAE